MMHTQEEMLNRRDGPPLAYRYTPGREPTVVFIHGLGSDMSGGKAIHLEQHCSRSGGAFLCFDCRGHGLSGGRFEEGCIGDWRADVLEMLDRVTPGPVVLVGSSMGGWLMLLAALARPERIRGLVGIAAAPDFTHDLILPSLSVEDRRVLARDGVLLAPSAYGEPIPITSLLLEDGEGHLLLRRPIALDCPVHLLHGQLDPDIPWQTALRLAAVIAGGAVTVELIKDGDHRLSRDDDLRRIAAAVDRVLQRPDPHG